MVDAGGTGTVAMYSVLLSGFGDNETIEHASKVRDSCHFWKTLHYVTFGRNDNNLGSEIVTSCKKNYLSCTL